MSARTPEIPAETWGLWHAEDGWYRPDTDFTSDPSGPIAVYTTKAAARRASITDDGERLGRPVRIGVAPARLRRAGVTPLMTTPAAGRPGPEPATPPEPVYLIRKGNKWLPDHTGQPATFADVEAARDAILDRDESIEPMVRESRLTEALAAASRLASGAADAARAEIVERLEREVERMRRKVEPPPGGGCYLREDDDLGRLDAYEHALSLARSAGAGQATEGDAHGD
jgi:hypothetical protein